MSVKNHFAAAFESFKVCVEACNEKGSTKAHVKPLFRDALFKCHPDKVKLVEYNKEHRDCLLAMCKCLNTLFDTVGVSVASDSENLDVEQVIDTAETLCPTPNELNILQQAIIGNITTAAPSPTVSNKQTGRQAMESALLRVSTIMAIKRAMGVWAWNANKSDRLEASTKPAIAKNITAAKRAAREALWKATGTDGGDTSRKQFFLCRSAEIATDVKKGVSKAPAELYDFLKEHRKSNRNWLVREYQSFYALMGIQADPNCTSVKILLEKLNPAKK
jgi:hypothetical protein